MQNPTHTHCHTPCGAVPSSPSRARPPGMEVQDRRHATALQLLRHDLPELLASASPNEGLEDGTNPTLRPGDEGYWRPDLSDPYKPMNDATAGVIMSSRQLRAQLEGLVAAEAASPPSHTFFPRMMDQVRAALPCPAQPCPALPCAARTGAAAGKPARTALARAALRCFPPLACSGGARGAAPPGEGLAQRVRRTRRSNRCWCHRRRRRRHQQPGCGKQGAAASCPAGAFKSALLSAGSAASQGPAGLFRKAEAPQLCSKGTHCTEVLWSRRSLRWTMRWAPLPPQPPPPRRPQPPCNRRAACRSGRASLSWRTCGCRTARVCRPWCRAMPSQVRACLGLAPFATPVAGLMRLTPWTARVPAALAAAGLVQRPMFREGQVASLGGDGGGGGLGLPALAPPSGSSEFEGDLGVRAVRWPAAVRGRQWWHALDQEEKDVVTAVSEERLAIG